MTEDNNTKKSKSLHDEQTMEFININWLVDHHKTKKKERSRMVDSLNLKSGDKVLDLGCGPGLWTPIFAEKVKPSGKVIGIDISGDLLDYARENLKNTPLKDIIEFRQADLNDIPFEDNEFDVVFFGNCFAYVKDHSKVLEELKRVAKEGGRVVAKDFDGAIIIFHPIAPHLQLKVLTANSKGLEENPPNPPFDNYAGRKMHGFFLHAGFKNITTKTYAIQKVPPLTPEAIRYITGNAEWYAKIGAPYLSEEDLREWQAYFDPFSDEYIFDLKEFYFCMLEVMIEGTV